jgi:hypothetical protein
MDENDTASDVTDLPTGLHFDVNSSLRTTWLIEPLWLRLLVQTVCSSSGNGSNVRQREVSKKKTPGHGLRHCRRQAFPSRRQASTPHPTNVQLQQIMSGIFSASLGAECLPTSRCSVAIRTVYKRGTEMRPKSLKSARAAPPWRRGLEKLYYTLSRRIINPPIFAIHFA